MIRSFTHLTLNQQELLPLSPVCWDLIGDALDTDGLSMNLRKTVSMFLQPKRSLPMGGVQASYQGAPLAVVSAIRSLGTVMDNGLI